MTRFSGGPTALAALGLVACAGPGSDDSASPVDPRPDAALVAMDAWARGDVSVQAEPLADHFTADQDCPDAGALVEGASFEVSTGTCTHGWFQQPALADLVAGDPVEFVFWHGALVSDEPGAQGHIALFVGDELLYERFVDIPSDPMAYTERLQAPFDAAAGATVTLHLHNHGANGWNLLRLERKTE